MRDEKPYGIIRYEYRQEMRKAWKKFIGQGGLVWKRWKLPRGDPI